mmetsp:Transcript_25780/g.49118  ORF Transcript_25780/g.49118 Transcript_25780/m.49118 type:complete len:224 (+) Transcript_25780:420-1091(+)
MQVCELVFWDDSPIPDPHSKGALLLPLSLLRLLPTAQPRAQQIIQTSLGLLRLLLLHHRALRRRRRGLLPIRIRRIVIRHAIETLAAIPRPHFRVLARHVQVQRGRFDVDHEGRHAHLAFESLAIGGRFGGGGGALFRRFAGIFEVFLAGCRGFLCVPSSHFESAVVFGGMEGGWCERVRSAERWDEAVRVVVGWQYGTGDRVGMGMMRRLEMEGQMDGPPLS